MILIIGLGNKGNKFKNTRHNIGAEILIHFTENNHYQSFKLEKKLQSLISKNEEIILAIPQCFMNESGEIVKKLVDYFKISLDNLLVIHDDTDIRLGEFKIQKNRGAAGHKGLESIINCLKSKNFWRLRIGVRSPKVIHQKAEEIVLKKFTREERRIIQQIEPVIFGKILQWIQQVKMQ
ncbi:MAG: aminoacyl-tRNA hydrolase [Candidatus Pacebacteria bacterium]|nr:aminoacyl-tRNA hydrolase [Candidatus Paceibacterota bacterium]